MQVCMQVCFCMCASIHMWECKSLCACVCVYMCTSVCMTNHFKSLKYVMENWEAVWNHQGWNCMKISKQGG